LSRVLFGEYYPGRLLLYVGLAAIVYIGARSRLGAQPQLEVK
jgi:hypothetical protein